MNSASLTAVAEHAGIVGVGEDVLRLTRKRSYPGYVRADGETLVPPRRLDLDPDQPWKLENAKGYAPQSPNVLLNDMSPEDREAHLAKYKQGGPAGRPTREEASA